MVNEELQLEHSSLGVEWMLQGWVVRSRLGSEKSQVPSSQPAKGSKLQAESSVHPGKTQDPSSSTAKGS